MTLTVADIGRWDAGDVREVFHAATSRAQAAFDAADGLAELPAFETWGGEAADAAREAIRRTWWIWTPTAAKHSPSPTPPAGLPTASTASKAIWPN